MGNWTRSFMGLHRASPANKTSFTRGLPSAIRENGEDENRSPQNLAESLEKLEEWKTFANGVRQHMLHCFGNLDGGIGLAKGFLQLGSMSESAVSKFGTELLCNLLALGARALGPVTELGVGAFDAVLSGITADAEISLWQEKASATAFCTEIQLNLAAQRDQFVAQFDSMVRTQSKAFKKPTEAGDWLDDLERVLIEIQKKVPSQQKVMKEIFIQWVRANEAKCFSEMSEQRGYVMVEFRADEKKGYGFEKVSLESPAADSIIKAFKAHRMLRDEFSLRVVRDLPFRTKVVVSTNGVHSSQALYGPNDELMRYEESENAIRYFDSNFGFEPIRAKNPALLDAPISWSLF